MTEIQPFRGLAHVVEVWRKAQDRWDDAVTMDSELRNVLDMADEYMTEVESEKPVNEAAPHPAHDHTDGAYLPTTDPPVGLMVERQCNGGMNHHGHPWRDPTIGMERVWCNGVTSQTRPGPT